MANRAFACHIGIDYSGAQTPTASHRVYASIWPSEMRHRSNARATQVKGWILGVPGLI